MFIFTSVTNLYNSNMLSAKISKEYINSGISSQSIDTSGPSTDTYSLNFIRLLRVVFTPSFHR